MIKSGFSSKALTQCVCKTDYFTHFLSIIVRYLLVLWKRPNVIIRYTYSSKKGYTNKIGIQGNEASLFFKSENPNL